MRPRIELQQILEEIPGLAFDRFLDGPAVYFQPPSGHLMVFPCIVYQWETPQLLNSDDEIYRKYNHYELTYMTTDPDDPTPDLLLKTFRHISPSKPFTSDNKYHFPYSLYF